MKNWKQHLEWSAAEVKKTVKNWLTKPQNDNQINNEKEQSNKATNILCKQQGWMELQSNGRVKNSNLKQDRQGQLSKRNRQGSMQNNNFVMNKRPTESKIWHS